MVITGDVHHAGRASALLEGWLSHVPCYAVYSDTADPGLGIVGLPVEGKGYGPSQRKWPLALNASYFQDDAAALCPAPRRNATASAVERARAALHERGAEGGGPLGSRFNWYMFVDDDTFVYLPHLLRALRRFDSSLPYAIGATDSVKVRATGLMGGAGMAYSKPVIDALMQGQLLLECDKQWPYNGDTVLMMCLRFRAFAWVPRTIVFDVCGFGISDLQTYVADGLSIEYLVSLHLHGNGSEMRDMYRQFYGQGGGPSEMSKRFHRCTGRVRAT
jgi:hypothetical protein